MTDTDKSTKRVRKKASTPNKIPSQKVGESAGPVEKILETKVSKRTLLKGTMAAGAVVGVSALALRGGVLQTSGSGIQQTSSVPAVPAAAAANPFAAQTVTFTVNGTSYTVSVEPRDMLATVLREDLGLVGTKMGCNRMACGACTVLIDGEAHEACQYPAIRAGGHTILTTEGGLPTMSSTGTVAVPADPVIAALQAAWVQNDGGQCAFCSPGSIMAAAALLKQNTSPTVAQIQQALSGNLCRCGNYLNIIASVQLAATNLGGA